MGHFFIVHQTMNAAMASTAAISSRMIQNPFIGAAILRASSSW
jgi:hypothetical protein